MDKKLDTAPDLRDGDSPVVLTRFRLVRLCAFGIMMLLFVFMMGYFLGKMHSFSDPATCESKDVFRDHIYSMHRTEYAMGGQGEPSNTKETTEDTV